MTIFEITIGKVTRMIMDKLARERLDRLEERQTLTEGRLNGLTNVPEGSEEGSYPEIRAARVDGAGQAYDSLGEAMLAQVPKSAIVQELGNSPTAVMSQEATTAAIGEVKETLVDYVGVEKIVFTKESAIDTGEVGTTIDITPNTNIGWYSCAVVECEENDKFNFSLYSDSNGFRKYCFIDKNNVVLSVSPNVASITEVEIFAPTNAKKCVINSDTTRLGECTVSRKGNTKCDREIVPISEKVSEHDNEIYKTVYNYGTPALKHIASNGTINDNHNMNVCFENPVFAQKGSTITVDGSEYKFMVALYDSITGAFIERTSWFEYGTVYKLTNDYQVRVEISIVGEPELTDTSIFEHLKCSLFAPRISKIEQTKNYVDEAFEQVSSVVDILGTDMFKNKVITIAKPNKYSAWSMFGIVDDKLICIYTVADAHDSSNATIVYKTSKNGVVWSIAKPVPFETQSDVMGVTGVGNDNNGNLLLWVRNGAPALRATTHELYKFDGATFSRISVPNFELRGGHIGDIISVPNVGLVAFYNTYINGNISRSWGMLKSTDNGLTWTQTPIETDLSKAECPVEIDAVYLGDGKILAMGRKDDYTGTMAMFQMQSTDNGNTWSKVYTNITDINASSPSILLDGENNELSLYYYDRGTGNCNLRRNAYTDVWDNPTNWNTPTLVSKGATGQDAGNVKAVEFNGNQICTYYSGNSTDCGIYAVIN